ncbi:MAG: tetratricopeptide repeat protein [Bacteroidota bacterium]
MRKLILHIVLILISGMSFSQTSQQAWFDYLAEIKSAEAECEIPQAFISQLENDEAQSLYLAELLYNNGCYDGLKPLIDMFPDNREMQYYAAVYYAANNKPKDAVNRLRDHILSANRKPRGEIRAAGVFKNIQNADEWKSLWLEDNYKTRELDYEAALNFYRDSNYNWALEELQPLLQSYPSQPAYSCLAARIHQKKENFRLALRYADQSISNGPREPEYHQLAAEIYLSLHKPGKAVSAIEEAISLAPWMPALYPLYARSLNEAGRFETSVSALQPYVKSFAEPQAFYLISVAKFNTGKFHDVIRYMNKALASDPSEHEYFVIRADAFRETGSYTNAFKDYAMALDIKPDLPEVYFNFALARHKSGDEEGACYLWRKARHFGHPDAADMIYRFCRK